MVATIIMKTTGSIIIEPTSIRMLMIIIVTIEMVAPIKISRTYMYNHYNGSKLLTLTITATKEVRLEQR